MTEDYKFFVGIGAQKSGTSWLYTYLRNRTTAQLSAVKELHWFDEQTGKTSGFHATYQARARQFLSDRKTTGKQLTTAQMQLVERAGFQSDDDYRTFFTNHFNIEDTFGEITPSYNLLDKAGFKRILKIFPATKFIFIMRNPADRFWSHLNHKANRDKHFDPQQQFAESLQNPDFIGRGDYASTINTLTSVVNRDRLFCTFYEDLFGPKGTTILAELCSFLGINGQDPEFKKVVNTTNSAPMPDVLRQQAVKANMGTYRWAAKEFPAMPQSWHDDLAR
jgi:hypothetical protein